MPLAESTNPYLGLSVEVIWNNSNTRATYTIEVALFEKLIIYRNRIPYQRVVVTWQSGSIGHVGRNLARESFLNSIEERAERVANLYLSAN